MTTTDLIPTPTTPTGLTGPGRTGTAGRRDRSPAADAAPRLTTGRVVRSEWIKFWSIRSTVITLAALLAVTVAFGVIAALVSTGSTTTTTGGGSGAGGAGSSALSTVLTGSTFAVLIAAVLGALVGAREFASGMIRTTVATVPARLTVLWAKTLTLIAGLLPAAVIGVFGAYLAGMAILSAHGAHTTSLTDTTTLRVLLGTIAYITGIGVIGLALGFVFRSIATSMATLIGGVLILPNIISALLPDSWSSLLKFLPSNAAQAFTQVTSSSSTLSAGAGAVVFTLWVAAALALAASTLKRRDV